MTFAEKLKKAREDSKLSQRKVAESIGVSQPQYCYYENGDDMPSFSKIKALARLFNVSLDYFDDDK